jgi:hypothetical protein
MQTSSNSAHAAHQKNAADLIRVPFHGGELLAGGGEYANPGDRPVPLRPACDRLGVDLSGQLQKLRGKAWACVEIISMRMPGDDQERPTACLPLRALPMWLTSITPSKVAPEMRTTLEAYQLEAADVLYRHFMPQAAANDVDIATLLARALAEVVTPLVTKISMLQHEARERDAMLREVQQRLYGNGTIGAARARAYVLAPLLTLAHEVDPDDWRRTRSRLDSELRASLSYYGPLDLMPEALLPLAHQRVIAMQRRERARYRRLPGLARTRGQMSLPLRPAVGAN